MSYATYAYYTAEYGGSALAEEEFLRYAKRASAEIDHVTFGRLRALPETQIPDAVRDAACAVAEQLCRFDKTAEGGSIASEQNDGYSVSYRDTGGTAAQQREVRATIRTYLGNTGLMYRGVTRRDLC